jgi:Ca-activated chloride channel homolog
MTFASPFALLGLALVPVLGLLWRRAEQARRVALAAFGPPGLASPESIGLPSRRRAIAHGLVLGGGACGVIALGRPQLGDAPRSLHRTSGDVLFVLDLSRSMAATDVAPSRLMAAKRAAATIARALPDDRVGLLVFGGTGFLQLPPTLDHSTFRLFLDAAGTGDIPDPSTNLEAAASVVAAALHDSVTAPYAAAVLLSDGEDVEGKLEQAIKTLSEGVVHTSAVGVGTPAGALLFDRDPRGVSVAHRDWAGREVTTHLVEQNLQDVARRTGGRYVRWSGDASVQPIIDYLGQVQRRAISGDIAAPRADRFQWLLAVALAALVASSLVVRGRRGSWQ